MVESASGKRRSDITRRVEFPRKARLRKSSDFKRVFRNPVVSSDSSFKILARPNGISRSRLGMAVSRQADKKAVGRNRIKRIVRESFRKGASASPCADFVVLPRREAATICNSRLFGSLEKHWSRIEAELHGKQDNNPAKSEKHSRGQLEGSR